MDLAFKYTENSPLETEANYPYTSGTGRVAKCSYDSSKGVVGAKTYSDVSTDSVSQLKAALNKGPVSVAIEADTTVFNQYHSGVITSTQCGTTLDHGVLAVGYGTDTATGNEYYLVKNSWGPTWGEQGYVRIGVANGMGICGIQEDPSYPSM